MPATVGGWEEERNVKHIVIQHHPIHSKKSPILFCVSFSSLLCIKLSLPLPSRKGEYFFSLVGKVFLGLLLLLFPFLSHLPGHTCSRRRVGKIPFRLCLHSINLVKKKSPMGELTQLGMQFFSTVQHSSLITSLYVKRKS